MNKQQTLQDIWATTDQRVIDIMTKKTCKSSAILSTKYSDDDDSDLESVDSRYGPFAAVPKEFRPPSTICSKTDYSQMSLNENKQVLSNRQPTTVSKTSPEKAVSKVPRLPNSKPLCANIKPSPLPNTRPPLLPNPAPSFPPNPRPSMVPNPRPPLLPNPRPLMVPNPRPPLLPNPRPPFLSNSKASPLLNPNSQSMECKKVSNSNETSVLKQKVNRSNHPQNLENRYHVANDTTVVAPGKNNSDAKQKMSFQPPEKAIDNPLQKCNEVSSMKGRKHKNVIKYECVKKQEHKTVEFNFEMRQASTLQEGKEIMKRANKNFQDAIKRGINKNEHTISQENTLKWVSSLNSDEKYNSTGDKTGCVFNKVTHRVVCQENIVKWDSSLNLDLSDNVKGKIERDSGGMEHAIKWHSSSNLNESSSDGEGKIKWTVIQEKKTIISAERIEGKNTTQKQDKNKYLPTKPFPKNELEKPKKHQRKKNFNTRMKQTKHYYRKNSPKHECKIPENPVYKNDLHLNNNMKCVHNEIRNFATQNEHTVEAETFTQQCRIRDQNLDSAKVNPNASSNRSEVTIESNARKYINNGDSNSYPEKIDNIKLTHTEKQKESLLYYGREIADLIIGSHAALSIFVSMFREWKRSRLDLISHFQQLENNLKESSKKFTKYKDMLNIAKTGVTVAAAVPIPHVSVAARVISVLTSLFSVFLSGAEKKSSEIEETCDIGITATRDRSASTDLYMFGLQCGQNFEDTAKMIEEFHSNVIDIDREIFENDSPEIATFISGILEYRPRHRNIFYKKLQRCFQELMQNCSSEFGKRFCEPFLLNSPGTIDVVEFLNWRFRHEDFNGESVRYELEQIEHLIQGNDTNIKQLTDRIKTCVGILQDELKFLEGCVKDFNLFDKAMQF